MGEAAPFPAVNGETQAQALAALHEVSSSLIGYSASHAEALRRVGALSSGPRHRARWRRWRWRCSTPIVASAANRCSSTSAGERPGSRRTSRSRPAAPKPPPKLRAAPPIRASSRSRSRSAASPSSTIWRACARSRRSAARATAARRQRQPRRRRSAGAGGRARSAPLTGRAVRAAMPPSGLRGLPPAARAGHPRGG